MANNNRPTNGGTEQRAWAHQVEIRSMDNPGDQGEAKMPVIRGYAAKFNMDSHVLGYYQFIERIDPSAFDECDMTDVRCLFNHDKSKLLGRTKSGTLRMGVDSLGLWYEDDLPDTHLGEEMRELVKRGDIAESSFQFTVVSSKWDESGEIPVRTILKIDKVYDVSPVTFPAYPDTTVAEKEAREMLKGKPNKEGFTIIDADMRLAQISIAMTDF